MHMSKGVFSDIAAQLIVKVKEKNQKNRMFKKEEITTVIYSQTYCLFIAKHLTWQA